MPTIKKTTKRISKEETPQLDEENADQVETLVEQEAPKKTPPLATVTSGPLYLKVTFAQHKDEEGNYVDDPTKVPRTTLFIGQDKYTPLTFQQLALFVKQIRDEPKFNEWLKKELAQTQVDSF